MHVERGEGLVQHPQQAVCGQEQARQAHAATLTLGQHARRQVELVGQPDALQRVDAALLNDIVAGGRTRKAQVLERGEQVVQRRRMAEIEQLAMEGLALAADRMPAPAHFTGLGHGESSHQAQQAGLADAIGAGHAQQPPCLQAEGEVAEEQAIALEAGELVDFEHGDGLNHSRDRKRHPGAPGKARPRAAPNESAGAGPSFWRSGKGMRRAAQFLLTGGCSTSGATLSRWTPMFWSTGGSECAMPLWQSMQVLPSAKPAWCIWFERRPCTE